MKYINHFTLNTGHNRKSYPSEIDKGFYFKFATIINDIIASGEICEFYIEGTYLKITTNGNDNYFATLHIDFNGEKIPIFATVATSNPDKRVQVISDIKPYFKLCASHGTFLPPDAPLIIDIVLPQIMLAPYVLEYTGDLSRCLAWTILFPQDIVKSD